MSFHDVTAPTVNLLGVAHQLGVRSYGDLRQRKYITLLIELHGFPPPLPALITGHGGPRLERAVVHNSCWRRDAVEAWLDDFLPPANADQIDAAACARAAADMDAKAGGLQLLIGGRR